MVGTHAFLSPASPSLRTVGVNRGKASPLSPSFRRQSVVVMGIPKLFRWLVDLYPAVQQRVGETLGTETAKVENFYLDMNGIIHMCTHANAEELIVLDERKMFQRIFTYTDRLYKIVAPTRAMFLAIDGVAPRAKMNQQRARRFRSSKDQEALMAEMGRPYTPLMQLLNVLPSQSGPFLPEPYRDLMTQEDSPLRRFYPPDFETDQNGKQNAWESVVLIPFIDEDLMVSALAQVDHRTALSEEERARNVLGKEHTFWPAKGHGPPVGRQLSGLVDGRKKGKSRATHHGVPRQMPEPEEFDD
ncbi:hypothetical protein NSK_005197 [Nannochloropsis salina CCMP1776]|uniref:Xrn1 N-terminal domain-containing protein n=1 Tax=Nannochloropsis salina CCMP1776 TaxID=1027361 RepID=A0A4D9CYF6_9STRA|nr:hypothetical protein NSK_005197 [Nannochloropsis salina CCMP1776]|eukprot:TFJ83504.1 hypothetical protein NSK_005197 [Nannochloropsis salina CCMP1776]